MILILSFIKHSVCPNLTQYPKFTSNLAIFGSFLQKFSSYFKTSTYFLTYPKGEYLPTMISDKNAVREPTAGVNEAKICLKIAENCSYFCIKCNNSNIIQYFNIFLCFTKKAYLGSMISSKKEVKEPTAEVIGLKICLKNGRKLLMFLL